MVSCFKALTLVQEMKLEVRNDYFFQMLAVLSFLFAFLL